MNTRNIAILIPARYDSSRFPAKMLSDLDGKTLIRRVYDICWSTGIDTYVLTDDERIANAVPNSIMTSKDHDNGTSRCSEVIEKLNYNKFINVQGDMPDITPEIIEKIASWLERYGYDAFEGGSVVTAYTKMPPEKQHNPNVVKMIHTDGHVHWFCRSALFYGSHHLGVYGYTKGALANYNKLKVYSEEQMEKLEQLRWLQNGISISAVEVEFDGIEINSPEDLEMWNAINK
jgi:3-deoxy-manno-octulosonate cytidylyltransferase (CMP-KDO synthetase)